MAEYSPQIKRDEQYPLLKVEGGGGDNNPVQTPFAQNATVGWNVSCAPKQSWCKRWPEYVSACWMTIILLAISFLVFYALGMSAYRRQPLVFVKCNNSKPAGDVFYHHIVSQDYIPFSVFSDYLSFMAREYPALRFHIYFLVDDTWKNQNQRQPRLLKRLVPHITSPFNSVFKHNREIRDFQRKFQNVNISVMNLSKYMGATPLRYKWKMIPQTYLTFYARVYEIWRNGGVGFDLVMFNNQFNNNQELDHRLTAVLKQHSNGIEPEKYNNMLNFINNDDENEIFSMFFYLINTLVNETSSFFNTDYTSNTKNDNEPVIRTHRSRRNVAINANELISENATKTNNTIFATKGFEIHNVTEKEILVNSSSLNNTIKMANKYDLLNFTNHEVNGTYVPMVFFYDINKFTLDTDPINSLPKSIGQSEQLMNPVPGYSGHGKHSSRYLLLSPEGHFIAASSHHHPFLAQLFSSSCHRLDPVFAIRDTHLSQCSGFFRDDVYCENIRFIYNII